MPLKLQFFAEGGDETEVQGEESQDQKASFEDVLKDKDYQSAFDKKIAKALETAKSKWETDYTKKLEDAKSEAEKLSKMKAEEKAQYEIDKREKEYAEKLKELNMRELKAEAQSQLVEVGLSKEFVGLLNYESAETVKASIDALSNAFNKALEEKVNEKLGSTGETHKRGTGSVATTADEVYKQYLENPSQGLWEKFQTLNNK